MVRLDLLRALEQETRLAGLDHTQIVIAVAAGDGLVSNGLQCLDRGQLGLLYPHFVAGDLPVLRHLQGVAENGGPAQLFHQGLGELLKGVAQDDHLGDGAQLVQKRLSTGERIDLCNRLLDFPESQAVFLQNSQAPFHQFVVIRLVPGRPPQFRNSAGLRECNPNLRHQNAFHVQAYNVHRFSPLLQIQNG